LVCVHVAPPGLAAAEEVHAGWVVLTILPESPKKPLDSADNCIYN
jgi:hypothetical protein